jgi:hypothetical protein
MGHPPQIFEYELIRKDDNLADSCNSNLVKNDFDVAISHPCIHGKINFSLGAVSDGSSYTISQIVTSDAGISKVDLSISKHSDAHHILTPGPRL